MCASSRSSACTPSSQLLSPIASKRMAEWPTKPTTLRAGRSACTLSKYSPKLVQFHGRPSMMASAAMFSTASMSLAR